MKPNLQKDGLRARRRLGFERSSVPSRRSGIALVITLLMLAAITFLAIAFLAMTRRDRAAATAGVDLNISRQMSEAAFARAQAEIVARMMAQNDMLSYDYIASHNFISPSGFSHRVASLNNVNYDFISNEFLLPSNAVVVLSAQKVSLMSSTGDPADWAQNIANLYYDPRPPVFVTTNGPNGVTGTDFRYWVDINQNDHFEGAGWVSNSVNGELIATWNPNGEPEWIGVLRDPLFPHSATNPFVGRYAYMVLPIGKTLDLNFIHNFSKALGPNDLVRSINSSSPTLLPLTTGCDGFSRDQGVGSWELNLAATLLDLNTNMYLNVASGYQYDYIVPSNPGAQVAANSGYAFNDAWSMLYYRYGAPYYSNWFPAPLTGLFSNYTSFERDGIDESGAEPSLSPSNQFAFATDPDVSAALNGPSPLGYNTNMYYDMEDLFDPTKTSTFFTNHLIQTMMTNDTYDQNTFQRLLASIGTGSSPEYGTYVYSNGFTFYSNTTTGSTTASALVYTTNFLYANNLTPVGGTLPTYLRCKVNLNYDNTYQIAGSNAPFVPASSNLVSWGPLAFFTNAADLLLRSQEFPVTNLFGRIIAYNHFGITNIPIYNSTNASFCYNAQIHRMLQLAANIYESVNATNTNTMTVFGTPQFCPQVYRPIFSAGYANGAFTVSIIGYTNVPRFTWQNDLLQPSTYPFRDVFDSTNIIRDLASHPNNVNIWGVPWVIGAVKGLPSFNRYSYGEALALERDLVFVRNYISPNSYGAIQYTNQFYLMSISNVFGMDAWNSYNADLTGTFNIYASNNISITLTNNYNYGYTTNIHSPYMTSPLLQPTRWAGLRSAMLTPGKVLPSFIPLLQTNVTVVPLGYFSTYWKTYTNIVPSTLTSELTPTFTPADLEQTGFPEYDWSLTVTNHAFYIMSDNNGNLLDFVNLGPFGTSNNVTAEITNVSYAAYHNQSGNLWNIGRATPSANSPMSMGTSNTILASMALDATFAKNITTPTGTVGWFSPGSFPVALVSHSFDWVANDPMVHYTVDDLTWPANTNIFVSIPQPAAVPNGAAPTVTMPLYPILSNSVGTVSARYAPWGTGPGATPSGPPEWAFEDALITGSDAWEFPTNKFPGVGWLGRVHRGTPWQTVYLKSYPVPAATWTAWVNSPYTTPTNDWPLVDLFMASPNDNAARGLLSVNQTNDAAWAAVFAGVIVSNTTVNSWVPINPTNDIYYIMDTNGINSIRKNYINGNFHHIGDILAAPALTVNADGALFNGLSADAVPDYVTERIPQQTLSLLKLGMPQFVIYAWGQSLRPKQRYLYADANQNICTNYEITGEYLSRVVCHIVNGPIATTDLIGPPGNAGTQGSPKIVIDSYNIEPGN